MNQTYSDKVFLTLGSGFLVFWAIDFIAKASWYGVGSFEFMFFCSILLLFGAVGFLLEKTELILAVFVMAFFFQIPWIIDMTSIAFRGVPVLGVANYLFTATPGEFLISLRHLFMIPIIAYGISYMDFSKITVWRSSGYSVGIFCLGILIPFFLAPDSSSINYTNLDRYPIPMATMDGTIAVFIACNVTVMILLIAINILIAKKILFVPGWRKLFRNVVGVLIVIGSVIAMVGFARLF